MYNSELLRTTCNHQVNAKEEGKQLQMFDEFIQRYKKSYLADKKGENLLFR